MIINKGQIDFPVITWVFIIFGLILIAPVVLKIFNSVQAPLSSQFGNMSGGAQAQAGFNKVMNTGILFWDKVIVACFFISIIMLTISAIFIDTNPFFILLYIFIAFMLVLFAPDIMGSLNSLYTSDQFQIEVGQLSLTDSIRTHFIEFLVGVIVFTGIIIYGKVALFKPSGGRK